MLGRTWPIWGETSLFHHPLRSRRAFLLAGGCCSSLLAVALPSEAVAQTADQPNPSVTQPEAAPSPGDVNVVQPATAPGDATTPPQDQGTIVVTGYRRSV